MVFSTPPQNHQQPTGPPANKPKGQKPPPPTRVAQDAHLLERTPSPQRTAPPIARSLSKELNNATTPGQGGGSHKIHTGPRGGKFVIVNGQKKYIK